MSEISVVVVGSTSINSVVGNGDTVNVSIGGDSGGNGAAATLQVGSVVTLSATETASIVNSGTAYAAKLDFAIPRGFTGNTGPQGPITTLKIGTVVTGSDAAATITGTGTTQSLNLVLPQGATGERGLQGEVGPAGPANSLTVGSVTTTDATTASVSITGNSPSQQISFVVPRGPAGPTGGPGPYTTVKTGTVTTGAAGSSAKIDTVTSDGTVTLNFTIPRGYDGTSNLGDETPQPLGVANAGSAIVAARADHVHPLQVVSYTALTNVPGSFTPASHTHAISEVQNLQAVLDGKQAAGSYATLVNGLVPSSQLPGFVDDIVEAANYAALPATGEAGKLYVAVDTRKLWRWSGSGYVEIASSPGSTDSVTEGSTNLYFTTVRAAAAAPVQSVNGKTGNVTIEAGGIAWSSAPTSTTTVTKSGNLSYDADFLYVANDTNQWRRTSLEDWATPAITISVQPSNQTAISGAATFSVTASATQNAELLYQWQRQAGGTGGWTNIAAGLSATLDLVDLSYAANNGDKYRVVISSGAAGTGGTAVNGWLPAVVVELTPTATLTSGEATLTVSAAISIITQPQSVSLTNGTSATFSVSATTPGSGLSYQWQSSPDGTNWTNINSANSASYSLSGITETAYDGYRYRCVVSSSGYDDATSAAATLDVAPITVTSQPTSRTGTPVAGTTPNYSASFSSAATSPAGVPTLQWEVSTDGGTTYSDVSGETSSSLSLTGLTSADSGKRYRAKFQRSGWNTVRSNAATLTVPTDVITVSQQPSSVTASVSQYSATAFSLPSGTWNGVSNANGTWFATPNDTLGGDYIATSGNGTTWAKTVAALPFAGRWSPVVYGGGVYVTVKHGSSQAASSTDGVNWTERTLPSVINTPSVVWNGSKFFAIGSSGTSATSSDGVSWSATTLPSQYSSWQAIKVVGANVYAVGYAFSGGIRVLKVAGSSDGGATWSLAGGTVQFLSNNKPTFVDLVVDGSRIVVYAYSSSDATGLVALSTNSGVDFTTQFPPFLFLAVARGSRYVSITTAGIASSTDGVNWVLRQTFATGIQSGRIVATSNGYAASVVRDNTGPTSSANTILLTSSDGLTWTQRTTDGANSYLSADGLTSVGLVAYGNKALAAANSSGSLYDIGGVLSASFSAAATTTFGPPSLQWQKSTDGGATWTNVSGAVSSPYQFTPVSGDTGSRYRAVFTKNSYTTVNSNSATLTVP